MSTYFIRLTLLIIGSGLARADEPADSAGTAGLVTSAVVSLDGHQWLLATDPKNEGHQHPAHGK